MDKINEVCKLRKVKTNVLILEDTEINNLEFDNLNILNLNNCSKEYNHKIYYDNEYCYIYFTSGSTGIPKAVLGRHNSLVHFIDWEIKQFSINDKFRVSQLIYPGFDAFLRDVFVPLCAGGTLCIPDNKELSLNTDKLIEWIEEKQITLIHTVPSVFKMISSEITDNIKFDSLKYILMAGELLRGNDINKFITMYGKRIKLINLYGTTETTLIKAFYQIKEEDTKKSVIPVGKPISLTQILILDKNLRPCANGVIGEIYIRTPFMTAGYCNDRNFNKKVFIKNPLKDDQNDLVYKTGDLGKRSPDGDIQVLGRIDNQIKIRGMRVELGEIENRILKYEAIKEVVVLAIGEDIDKMLYAYITAYEKIEALELKNFLKKDLPEYMIPIKFVQLDKMPLNSNGKIDLKKLMRLYANNIIKKDYQKPKNKIEEDILKIWNEILAIDNISTDDNFFELGGHSLKAAALTAKFYKNLNIQIPINKIFEHPTISELAEIVSGLSIDKYIDIEALDEKPYYNISNSQKSIYVLQSFDKNNTVYNMPITLMLKGKIDVKKVENIFIKVINRHESLRTSFHLIDGIPMQKINKQVDFKITYVISNEEDNIEIDKYIYPFDLEKAPLIRVTMVKMSLDRHLLIVDMHHIIADGVSIGI
ncbi:MAG TPA: hypothetical protein DCM59_05020, partial [Clostridium sp.]|nr:hypothetical protein [Clostridium sp.]